MKKLKIYPIFLPNFGCKSRCVFCNQFVMTGEKPPIYEELLSISIPQDVDEIAFYGSTFTGLPYKVQENFLQLFPNIPKRVSTRPDEINKSVVELLKKYNVRTVELGIQSIFDDVLSESGRGYAIYEIERALRILEGKFDIIAHTMIGLPKSDLRKEVLTLNYLLERKIKEFRIHPTLIFRNTLLEEFYKTGKYEPLSLDEAIYRSALLLGLVESNEGKVLRLGYHVPVSQLNEIVAGPYHSRFGELSRQKLIKMIIVGLNISKVYFPKKYESWFSPVEIDKNIVDGEDIFFQELSYKRALKEFLDKNIPDLPK